MKFNYHFSNLLGTVYRKGNLIFTPDGNSVISPVGNKISVYDLKNHKSSTLPIESRFNFTTLSLSPNGILLIAVDEDGEVSVISLISRSIVHKLRTNRQILDVSFSPDGKRFAFTKENFVQVYRTPGAYDRDYNPFTLDRVLRGAFDDTTTIAWSSCSRIIAVGSKDNTTRLYALEKFSNFSVYCLGGHTDPIVAIFFEKDSLVCYTISRNGQLGVWESSLHPDELELDTKPVVTKKAKKKKNAEEDEDSEEGGEEEKTEGQEETIVADEQSSQSSKLFYKRLARHYLRDAMPKDDTKVNADDKELQRPKLVQPDVTAADFNSTTHILVTGFSNGVFFIHEMPEAQLIHSLSISEQSILSIALNPSGDWIAFGCEHLGQLLVWEWQSETFVLKQQGHFNNLTCMAYSPDGSTISTGGEDGKVKLWNVNSGFCFVTFTEHTSSITGIVYAPNGKVVLSASLDGTVRAFDTTRYRNFRTFTSPRPAQFGCIGIDASGELIAAGGVDIYEVFLWSLQTGRLLEVISAHEGPVSSLQFCPSVASSQLATVSWDKTLRLWDSLAVGNNNESMPLVSDATAVAYRPDGNQVAVATINGHISFFDTRSNLQTGSIEGKNDLYIGRSDTDLITAQKSKEGKGFFAALSYTADGSCILAGGHSKVICIYHVKEALLIKKFEITQSRSFDAMDEVISRKKMSEFGNLALVEDRDDSAGSKTIKLPGTRKGDLSSRAFKPEVRVSCLQFSPTGRDFAATSTEGLLIYSLDSKMFFDPFELDLEITPASTRQTLKSGEEFGRALLMSLRLNEHDLIREVLEQIPVREIQLISSNLPEPYVIRLLKFIGTELEASKHLHFYGVWCKNLLTHHGLWLKNKSTEHMPVLNLLQRNLTLKTKNLAELCERNLYTMRFLSTMSKLKNLPPDDEEAEEEEADKNGLDSSDDEMMDVAAMRALQSKWSDDDDSD